MNPEISNHFLLIPYYLLAILILWSFWKKDKWILSSLLGISFSSTPLFFIFLAKDIEHLKSFRIGLSVGIYASFVATIPILIFGWYLGKKVSNKVGALLFFVGLGLNLLVVKSYQYIVLKNAISLQKEIVFDCEKLPYHCAIRDNELHKIPLLKKSGADINAYDSLTRTPLWYGIKNEKAVEQLLLNGAKADSFNIYGETPLAYTLVISLTPNLNIAKMLISHGAEINRTVGYRKKISILNFAIVNENFDAINFALLNGANPTLDDGYRKTPCQRLLKLPKDKIKNLRKYCP